MGKAWTHRQIIAVSIVSTIALMALSFFIGYELRSIIPYNYQVSYGVVTP